MNTVDPQGDAFTELVIEIFRLNRLLVDEGDRLTRPAGLTSARWQVLGVVEHGPIPVAHVARMIGLTRQSVQQTADGLAKDGLIQYSDNPLHRRAKLMNITLQGRFALDDVLPRHAEWANRLGGAHSLNQLEDVLNILRQTREQIEQTHSNDEHD